MADLLSCTSWMQVKVNLEGAIQWYSAIQRILTHFYSQRFRFFSNEMQTRSL